MRRAAASRESLDLGEEAANGFSGNFHNLDDARQESAAATAAAKGRSSLSMRHRVAKSSSFAAADRDATQYIFSFFPPESVPEPVPRLVLCSAEDVPKLAPHCTQN